MAVQQHGDIKFLSKRLDAPVVVEVMHVSAAIEDEPYGSDRAVGCREIKGVVAGTREVLTRKRCNDGFRLRRESTDSS
jgi:hypothetical protein